MRRIFIVTRDMWKRSGVWRYRVPFFPNNKKIRKQNEELLTQYRGAADYYSLQVNWNWDRAMLKAFGVPDYEVVPMPEIDMTHAYDQYTRLNASIREANECATSLVLVTSPATSGSVSFSHALSQPTLRLPGRL